MDKRWSAGNAFYVEPASMTSAPAVRCSDCQFRWNSPAMAEGLRLLGSCPKCGGELLFASDAAAEQPVPERDERFDGPRKAPHLVMGIPRR
jgi:hypothetical protein